MRKTDLPAQQCSLARTAAIVGDGWTMLILRDAFLKVRRYEEFQRRSGMTRHVLAGRLRMLVDRGILKRVLYQSRPKRHEYRLTQRGRDLYPVMISLVHWGDVHLADDDGPPVLHKHRDCGCDFHPELVCSECDGKLSSWDVEARPGPGLADPGSLFAPVA